MNRMNEISIEIDIPHNGKPITKIEVSPKEKYLVTYSEDDHSIVVWNADKINNDKVDIENIDEGQLKLESSIPVNPNYDLHQMCVSDDKKLVYIYKDGTKNSDDIKKLNGSDKISKIEIYGIDMNNSQKSIKLDCDFGEYEYCTFNLKGELILYNVRVCKKRKNLIKRRRFILIYSTQTKNNKWKCKKLYEIPKDFKLISISKYDKFYLFSNNSIYELNLHTEKSIKLFGNDELMKNYHLKSKLGKYIRIFSNEKFICIKIKDEVIIYSIELEISIASLNINNALDIQLYNLTNHILGLIPLLLPLLSNNKIWNSIIGHCWKECLDRLEKNGQPPSGSLQIIQSNIKTTAKCVFGILDGNVWKFNLEEKISKINLAFENSHKKMHDTYEHLSVHLFNPQMDNIHALFQEVISNLKYKKKLEWVTNLIKWEIDIINHNDIKLQVFKQINNSIEWDLLICKHIENFNIHDGSVFLHGINSFKDDDIVIITSIGLFIYHFSENNKSISLNYFYYMESYDKEESLHYYKKTFLKLSTLPLPTYDSFKLSNSWISYIKDNKMILIKYGAKLLKFAIKEQKLELINSIYKNCINYFEEDLSNNRIFLSIITSTMPYLNDYFPDYISKYSLETTMVTDCPSYTIKYQHDTSYLYSFQYPQIVNLSQSILWLKYNILMDKLKRNHDKIFIIIQLLIILLILPLLPIYFITFYILSKYHFINDIYVNNAFSIYFGIVDIFSRKILRHRKTLSIIFMIPYIKFVNYPQNYSWFLELIKPQPSPFVNSINRDIYKTLNGEALINFKWNAYGKYYHSIIWIGFIFFLGCFNVAAGISQQYIDDNVRKQLLIASIILGFIHLSFEIRQFIYNPAKWMNDIGNIFDICVYTLPICTSVLWLQANNQIIPYLTFSCLFLNLKFISFFRIFEIYDVYYTIIIRIAKRVMFFFVCFIMVILTSFAFAFHILLSPKMNYSLDERIINDDPNNPWNIAPTYQVFENDTSINPNLIILQKPDENTNMFTNFATSFFATCLLLTGDTSSLSNWPYEKNPTLMILIILFSFITVIYILNVFITLFGEAMKDNNDSHLVMKAEYLVKIELFYLLPFQRRWKSWFPEVIHYYASVDKTRNEIKRMNKNKEWNINEFKELKQDLLNKLSIHDN